MLNNPSLQEEPRNQRTQLIPPSEVEPLLTWLEHTGRLLSQDVAVDHHRVMEDDLIDEIVDSNTYSDDEPEDLDDD